MPSHTTTDNQGNITIAGSLAEQTTNYSAPCQTAAWALAVTVEEWQNRVNDSKSMEEQLSPTVVRIGEELENDSLLTDMGTIQQGEEGPID